MRQWQTPPALQGTFPDNGKTPSPCREFPSDGGVAGQVAAYLLSPERFAGLWPFEQRAVMAMPEAPVHEDCCPILRQYNVRFAGNVFCMQPIPESSRMQSLTNNQLRPCVRPTDRRHVASACFRVVDINQLFSGAFSPVQQYADASAWPLPQTPAPRQSSQTACKPGYLKLGCGSSRHSPSGGRIPLV